MRQKPAPVNRGIWRVHLPQIARSVGRRMQQNKTDESWQSNEIRHGVRMRVRLAVPLVILSIAVSGCNTPPIPPGKSVDIPTAMEQVLAGLCSLKQDLAARKQDWGVAIDSITVELDLTVDGTKSPSMAVAPDIKFIPTVSYGQIITASRGSRLTLTLKNTGTGSAPSGIDCNASRSAN